MRQLELYIKNMVCPRCVKAVQDIFHKMGVTGAVTQLGKVTLAEAITEEQLGKLAESLMEIGFELLDDQRKQQIDRIKTIIIEQVHYAGDAKTKLSAILSGELNKEYSAISKLFSETEGITIEQFAILQKTEKVKELLVYDELNLNEIAYQLGYSSPAHLSGQFKKVTGLTPTQFKKLGIHLRKPLDGV